MASGAAVASAVIAGVSATASIGMGVKGAKDQKEAQEEAEMLAATQLADAQEKDRQLKNQARADAEQATAPKVEFGSEDEDGKTGSFNDFLSPSIDVSSKSLGNITPSGLGFAS